MNPSRPAPRLTARLSAWAQAAPWRGDLLRECNCKQIHGIHPAHAQPHLSPQNNTLTPSAHPPPCPAPFLPQHYPSLPFSFPSLVSFVVSSYTAALRQVILYNSPGLNPTPAHMHRIVHIAQALHDTLLHSRYHAPLAPLELNNNP